MAQLRPDSAPAGVPGVTIPHMYRQRTPMELRYRVFVVGMDGSDLSKRALRQACFLMEPKVDHIHVVTVVNPGEPPKVQQKDVMTDLSYLRAKQLEFAVVEKQEGWTVAGCLIYAANRVNHGSPVLVLGAFGQRGKGGGISRLGAVAEACMQRSKAPVILVRSNDPNLELHQRELIALRQNGKVNKNHTLNRAVIVDGSQISRNTFDEAIALCCPGDSMTVLHVRDPSEATPSSAAIKDRSNTRQYFEAECQKQDSVYPEIDIRYVDLPKCGSIGETLKKELDKSSYNMVAMGSIQLSDTTKKLYLGSVSAYIAAEAHVQHLLVVKRYTHA